MWMKHSFPPTHVYIFNVHAVCVHQMRNVHKQAKRKMWKCNKLQRKCSKRNQVKQQTLPLPLPTKKDYYHCLWLLLWLYMHLYMLNLKLRERRVDKRWIFYKIKISRELWNLWWNNNNNVMSLRIAGLFGCPYHLENCTSASVSIF